LKLDKENGKKPSCKLLFENTKEYEMCVHVSISKAINLYHLGFNKRL